MVEIIPKLRRHVDFSTFMIGAMWKINWINMENGEPLSFKPWCSGNPTGNPDCTFLKLVKFV